MKIERYDMIVIGAGPAGLSAAIEAAKKGLKPIVFDENAVISSDYISKYSKLAEKKIAVSNDIIVHDLVKKTEESDKVIKGGQK